MLPGIVAGLFAMAVAIVTKTVVAVVIFFVALSRRMSAVKWAIVGFMFDFWAFIFFLITLLRLNLKKCRSCGERVGNSEGFCPNCGERTYKTDDGKIAVKFILYIIIGVAAFSLIGGIYVGLTELWV